MIFWLYLAEIIDTLSIYTVILFWTLTIIFALTLSFGIFILISNCMSTYDGVSIQDLVKARRKIWLTIKRTKLIYIYICLILFDVCIPSKFLIYIKIAFNADAIVLEQLTPLQEKALKAIEISLNRYIEDTNKNKGK